MIVFERREDQFVRVVVQKFRCAVEKRRLILIALDDELLPAAEPMAALAEIRSYTADQEVRPTSRYMKNPGQHSRRGGLAMRSSHDDRGVTRKKIFFQQMRHRTVRQLFLEHLFHLQFFMGR